MIAYPLTAQDCFLPDVDHRELDVCLKLQRGAAEHESSWFAADGSHVSHLPLESLSPLVGLLTEVLAVFLRQQFNSASTAGLEWWINRNTSHGWHLDKDELLLSQYGKLRLPDLSFLYYVVQPSSGGEIELMPFPLMPPVCDFVDTHLVEPVVGRLVSFDSKIYHRVRPYNGTRLSIAMNAWSTPPLSFTGSQGLLL